MEESEELKNFKTKNNYKKSSKLGSIITFIITIAIIGGIIFIINYLTKPKMQYINIETELTETIIYVKITNLSENKEFEANDFYITNENNKIIKATKIEDASKQVSGENTKLKTQDKTITIKITFKQIFNKDKQPTLFYLGKELKLNNTIRI